MKVRKRLVCGAIVFIWTAIPAFEITTSFVFTDIVEDICSPQGAHGSHDAERTARSFEFVVAYVLPLSFVIFCYLRVVYALRTKVLLLLVFHTFLE